MPSAPPASAPRMDPRLRQRRAEVQRRAGRRRLRGFAASGAVVLLAAVAVLITRTPLADVDHVSVSGAEHTAVADILRATGLDRHPLLVDVDTADVARRAEALPWVRTAEVRRRWPNQVEIDLTERVAAAVVALPRGGWAVVDGTGRVLAHTPDPGGLPAVSGAASPGPPGSALASSAGPGLDVAIRLPAALRERVREVAVLDSGEIDLRLAPRGRVRLGPPDDLARKLQAADTVIARVDLRNVAVVDVRVPSAPVVTRG